MYSLRGEYTVLATCLTDPDMKQAFSHAAFTIMELLVVLMVLAILGILLMAVVPRALATVRSAACASNLRQIGVATLAYANDHNSKFPQGAGSKIQVGKYISAQLESYLGTSEKAKEVWFCPGNLKLREANRTNSPKIAGYIATAKMFGYNAASGTIGPLSILAVQEQYPPEERFLLCDLDAWSYTATPEIGGNYPPVHNLGRNYLYLDGHVKWIKAVQP